MKTTNILHIFGRMVCGGAELRTLDIMRHINQREYAFNFCTLSGLSGELDESIYNLGGKIFPAKLDIEFPLKFKRILIENRIDIVHSHVHLFSGIILFLAKEFGIKKRIAHFRSMDDGKKQTNFNSFKKQVYKWFVNNNATDILAVSEGAMSHAFGHGWMNDNRCKIVYNGIGVDKFKIPSEKAEICKGLGLPIDAKIYIHVGRLVEAKNHHKLVEVFNEILKRESSAFLLLAGRETDELGEKIRGQTAKLGIEKRIYFLGERNDVPRLLRCADLMIFPSRREGLPGAVLESCAAGTPVLGSDLPGIKEIASKFPDLVKMLPLSETDAVWAMTAIEKSRASTEEYDHRYCEMFLASDFNIEVCAKRFIEIWSQNA